MLALRSFVGTVASAAIAAAQGPLTDTLVVDLDTAPAAPRFARSSDPRPLAISAGRVVFVASSDDHGQEVWTTDGTAFGTRRMSDLAAGTASADPHDAITLPDGTVLIASTSDAYGDELFALDFGADDLRLVRDIQPGGSSAPDTFVVWRGEAWFHAAAAATGRELWRSDGRAAGTSLAADLATGAGSSFAGDEPITVAGDRLWFTVSYPAPALWVLDTPGSAPRQVAATNEGGAATAAIRDSLAALGSGLVFARIEPAGTQELWITDGTASGTRRLAQLATPAVRAVEMLTRIGGTLWFAATTTTTGTELWTTDGTAANTRRVVDLGPGPLDGYRGSFALVDEELLFAGYGGLAAGVELWISDGTAAGTRLAVDVRPGAASSSPMLFPIPGGPILFAADGEDVGRELFAYENGTARLVADIDPTPDGDGDPSLLGAARYGITLAARGDRTGTEPFVTDGTAAGTRLLANLRLDPRTGSSAPTAGTGVRGALFFRATSEDLGSEPWITDGTTGGTRSLGDLHPGPEGSAPAPLAELPTGLLFVANSAAVGTELWITAGDASSTRRLAVLDATGPRQWFRNSGVLDGIAYFIVFDGTLRRLWRSDGTVAGTWRVPGFSPFALPLAPELFYGPIDGRFVYRVSDTATGTEPWVTDGTAAGTALLLDIAPGPQGSRPEQFCRFGERMFFVADDGVRGAEPWVTDGTVTGTRLLADIAPGSFDSHPRNPVALGDRVLFVADDGTHGYELWVTDGTAAGTSLLADLRPGVASSAPVLPVGPSGALLLFHAGDAAGRRALWRSDGTTTGTVPLGFVRDTLGTITPLGDQGDWLISVDDPRFGVEWWHSDGTLAGTRALTDIAPGTLSSLPELLGRVADRAVFRATDVVHGAELHAFDLASTGAGVLASFGYGCGAPVRTSGGTRLGMAFGIESESTEPGSAGLLVFDVARRDVEIQPDCWLQLAEPQVVATRTADAAGRLRFGAAIPVDAALVGARACFQWAVLQRRGPIGGVVALSPGVEIVIAR